MIRGIRRAVSPVVIQGLSLHFDLTKSTTCIYALQQQVIEENVWV
jgi:hypothetical protein